MGYRPNRAAQQLAGKPSGIVAIVSRNWSNFLRQQLLTWLHVSAEEHGCRVLSATAQDSLEPLEQLIFDLKAQWIDGLIYVAFENEDQWPEVRRLLRGVPRSVTLIGDLEDSEIASVVSNPETAATQTMEHLARRGRSRPVFVSEREEGIDIRRRLKAMTSAGEWHDIPFDPSRVVYATLGWSISNPAHRPWFDELLTQILKERNADSIICDTDFTAVGLMRAARRQGVKIPEDLSFVGWGDLQFAANYDPPITSVSLQLPQLISEAFGYLDAENSSGEGRREVPTELKVRESS
jgi:DNA-binding LacI/PurR family transcriptional regulator